VKGSARTEKGTFKINYLAVRPERVEGGTANNDTVSKGGEGGFEIYPPTKVYVMIGPEGGFTEEEVKLAMKEGFVPVKLGQRILRTETATITLIGILQYELGDLG
jgi:16S rRNA (uracil1498-N3)-methyltransferase